MTTDRIVKVPIAEATTPPSGLIEHLKDKWWVTIGDCVVYWKSGQCYSPLCNSSEDVTRRLLMRMDFGLSEVTVQFLPSVFRTINPHDY